MMDLLGRQRRPVRWGWTRWFVMAAVLLVLAGGAWRVVRPWLTVALARTSVGCPERGELLYAALRILYPDRTWPRQGAVPSERQPGSSMVRWATPRGTWAFADADLKFLGAARLDNMWSTGCADADHDGCLEVVSRCLAARSSGSSNATIWRWVVLRLHAAHNEMLGVVSADWTAVRTAGARFDVAATWREEDGDGLEELVFQGIGYGRLPSGTMGLLPPTVLAVFGWTASAGKLAPRQLPADGSFLAWEPPEGEPVWTFPEQALEPLLDALVPLPDGFGTPPTTVPTSTHSSSR